MKLSVCVHFVVVIETLEAAAIGGAGFNRVGHIADASL